jgi:hypothetical protein
VLVKRITCEIVEQGSDSIGEVYDFWMAEWNRVFQQLIHKDANSEIFFGQSYFYVIKVDGQIAGIMSSAWQDVRIDPIKDHYYAAWPEASAYLKSYGIKNFHKMGMIVARRELIPEGFKMAPTIIGCGIKFACSLPGCQGIVSFPRTDNAVWRSCDEWGFRTPKAGLSMYNAPVNFVLLAPNEMKKAHPNSAVDAMVNDLWKNRVEKLKRVAA